MTEKIFVISLFVFAINYSMKEGEIFGFLGDWLGRVLPAKLHDPAFECVVCMAPWYGTALYWLIWADGYKEWLIVIIAAMGFNAILNQIIHRDE